jgi:hypothetical protein
MILHGIIAHNFMSLHGCQIGELDNHLYDGQINKDLQAGKSLNTSSVQVAGLIGSGNRTLLLDLFSSKFEHHFASHTFALEAWS